jgi:glycosyltransferase involved in cell wall biosynthesis
MQLAHSLESAHAVFLAAAEDESGPYTDTHGWTFTPSSFALLILELQALALIPFGITDIRPADGTEFYVWLSRMPSPENVESRRIELLRQIIVEREEQVKKIQMIRGTAMPPPRGAPEPEEPQQPTVVAIIPLYNGAPWIRDSLRSVLQQSHPADEIIVVDDGSTDDGPEIVEQIRCEHPQVTLLHMSQPGHNGGQSAARNFGVAHSKSDIIALLDQDDVWYANHIKVLYETMIEAGDEAEIGWLYSDLDEVDEHLNLVHRNYLTGLHATHPKIDLIQCLIGDMFVLPSSSFIVRRAFDDVGGFDERLSGYEDDDLFLRMFRRGWTNIYVNRPLTKWRIHTGSSSYSPRMAKSRRVYMRKLIDQFPDDPARVRYYRRDVIAPRFLPQFLAEYLIALKTDDEVHIQDCWDHLIELTGYLPENRKKMKLKAILWALRSPQFARRVTRIYTDTLPVRPLARWVFS